MHMTPPRLRLSDLPAAPTPPARARRRSRAVVFAVSALLALLVCLPASALADAPTGPPGPPPGNGTDLPPAPGTAPTTVPPGTPAAIPTTVTGPGRINANNVQFNRFAGSFAFAFACQQSGTIKVNVRAVASSPVATGKYTCATNRATARLKVSKKITKALKKHTNNAAFATLTEGGKSSKLYFTLHGGTRPDAGQGLLDRRPPAVHRRGRHAAGLPRRARLHDRDAHPRLHPRLDRLVHDRRRLALVRRQRRERRPLGHVDGVGDRHPAVPPRRRVAPVPWTWGPISFPAGQGIIAIGVYEIVYWVGGKPDYQWQYVNAGTTGAAAAGGGQPVLRVLSKRRARMRTA